MSILITGGAGYIGSHVAEKLIQQKFNVVIIDNLKTGYKKLISKKSIFIKSDISNRKLLVKTINKYKIQTIIHLAAYLNVSEAEKNTANKISYRLREKSLTGAVSSIRISL